jgi:hypothetical protein
MKDSPWARQRWVCDLGIENYLLAGMFGSSARYSGTNFTLDRQLGSRYAYYRKATRGHNTLTFDERGGFDPADAAASDQAVNIVSRLIVPPPSPETAGSRPKVKFTGLAQTLGQP